MTEMKCRKIFQTISKGIVLTKNKKRKRKEITMLNFSIQTKM